VSVLGEEHFSPGIIFFLMPSIGFDICQPYVSILRRGLKPSK